MNFLVGYESTYDGEAMLTQLCKLDYSGLLRPRFEDWRLDGHKSGEAYSGPTWVRANSHTQNIPFDDNPENMDTNPNRVKGDWKVYCRFRPDAGNKSENIWVTLGLITWSAHGETNTDGELATNNVVGPMGPYDTQEFPFWLERYK